jgi:hypothetical protein
MPIVDVADRLTAERVPQLHHGADNPLIAPDVILLSQMHQQDLQLLVNPRMPWRRR